ncbi:MAG: ribonuclease D, partial [Hyphomicrobium sp.]
CRSLSTADFVAVDTEFMREQTYWPELCLIQIASDNLKAIIDPFSPNLDLNSFFELMANPNVAKVFHAARQDIEIFFSRTGLIPSPIFDTQIAAAVCGYGESVSYMKLVKDITGYEIDKSSRFTDWARRPLSEKQLIYALGDVTYLCLIYKELISRLQKSGRETWLQEEMANLIKPETYTTRPEDAWKRLKLRIKNKKSFAVFIEVASWREKLAQKQNVPRNRILRDESLYDIASQCPVTLDQVSELRSLSEGFARSSRAKEIIEAVRIGLERDPKSLPTFDRGEQITPEASATIELLKVLLKSASARHQVASRLIADNEDLERIARENNPDVLALSGWRRKLFGEDALRLKKGQLALSLSEGEVVMFDIEK